MTHAAEIEPRHLGLPPRAATGADPLLGLEEAGSRHVQAVLGKVGGNRKKAAPILGIT
ncbi:MAG: hypothetical protein HY303_12570 [Candidatus Wallbacteria bacterium]|nr:hypothetical protein [Candidatus Wallbacteria bacterium]